MTVNVTAFGGDQHHARRLDSHRSQWPAGARDSWDGALAAVERFRIAPRGRTRGGWIVAAAFFIAARSPESKATPQE